MATDPRRATEAQWQEAIVEAAKATGWLVHAERPAQTGRGWATPIQGHKGFPDLVLVRGREMLVVELKRKPNKVEHMQQVWLDALALAGVDVRVVWVPEGAPTFLAELTARPKRGAA